ncbi:YggS family pyridoxal phosphate-dependent enzyme [Rhizorhapis sp. SPR117]|uniref:YggS family pyridoxal phosphate-dependent enzyme n=1 Tax=Rhizorhapis sp. SPR117 TaxID=2912611 RepID=UPI001F0247E8|nr:YggS family pyridoxal phosphate-dependent enzyme [Rhizorhapis sp. SPR117]
MTGESNDNEAAQRLARVCDRIDRAACNAGRKSEDVVLIAVSKTQGTDDIVPLIHAGQRVFGENRIQEAHAKWPALREVYQDISLHMVGQLQSNKAEEAVALFDFIHSLDRPSLLMAVARAMDKLGRHPPCFIQVNIGDESQKGGCAIDALPALIAAAQGAGIPLAGLMCVPPANVEAAPYFALLAKIARDHDLTGLSMGMSGDYETAVMLGATHIRVGTALFGARK